MHRVQSSAQAPHDRFGLPPLIQRPKALILVTQIDQCWAAQSGSPMRDLPSDLHALETYFDPLARGGTIRDRITQLPTLSPPPSELREPVFYRVGPAQGLITPEGRAARDLVDEALATDEDPVVLNETLADSLYRELLVWYRHLVFSRVNQVVDLLRGTGPRLHPVPIAAILLLLVNRSTSSERALLRPADPRRQRDFDEALRAPLVAFAKELVPGAPAGRGLNDISLSDGWVLPEARRRLGTALRLTPTDKAAYLADEDRALTVVASELALRRDLTWPSISRAYLALCSTYDSVRSTLAAFGVAYERPDHTRDVLTSLEERWSEARSPQPTERTEVP